MLTQARKSLNVAGFSLKFCVARYMKLVAGELGCDNSHFSLLLAAGKVSWGRTSATWWQKFHTYVKGVNGPNTTHKLMIVWWWPYSFALMRISPSDFPLLNEMMVVLLYISLSTGLSWIKCHLLIKTFLRFGKGRISFRPSLFFCKADFLSINSTSKVIFFYEIVRVTSSTKAFFQVVDVLIEEFSGGVTFGDSFCRWIQMSSREE